MSIIKYLSFVQQDLADEPTVAPVIPFPVVKPTDAASTVPVVNSHVEGDAIAEETVHPSPPYLWYASIVFFMLTVPCAVFICGGTRFTLLRRLVHKTRAGGYRRVSVDDVEK